MRHANGSLLDLLLELQTLDRVPRSGYFLRGISDCESVSEHTFHLAMLVWFLAGEEPAVDRARAVELALMHDLAELRIGDLPRTATTYLPADVKHAAERRAAADILAPADPRATALYEEYEEGATAEARFVRACDKLQLMIKVTVYESWGHRGLAEFWGNPANFPQVRVRVDRADLFRAPAATAAPLTAPPAPPDPPDRSPGSSRAAR